MDKHKKEMTPDRCVLDQGSFLFRLGFDHWVTSLSAGSTGLFLFGWNPFRSIHVLQRSIAIGIYVKRKKWKAQPAGVLTISGITFFRTISLSHFYLPCNTGFRTNNFRINGGKGRIQNICREIIDRKRRLWYNNNGLGRFRGERSFFVPAQKEMTLGDSVNNRQGSFLFSFGI